MTAPKFTDDQVRWIRAEYAADETLTAKHFADRYSVAIHTMCALISGKSYSHLPGAMELRIKRNGNRRSTPERDAEVLRLAALDWSNASIARQVGCSTSHVHYLRNEKYARQRA